MSTVLQIVSRALRLLRVVDPGEPLQAEDLETALVALNSMMARMEASGVSIGWTAVSNSAEPLPAPPECEEWIAAGLALRLAPEYAKTLDQATVEMYKTGLAATRRDILTASPLVLDSTLPVATARWNIYNDEPCA